MTVMCKKTMIVLSIIEKTDILDVAEWPEYTGVHAQMNYAIKENGWLDSYCNNSNNYCYIAKSDGIRIGFSLLILNSSYEAEFRIIIHPDFIGSGYGGKIIRKTLQIGFSDHKLKAINLIVRKNNSIAKRLYLKHGFILSGEKREIIQDQYIDFYVMKIVKENFIEGEI